MSGTADKIPGNIRGEFERLNVRRLTLVGPEPVLGRDHTLADSWSGDLFNS
jgi:hypothetical protein